ncbi:MAG: hypothetical protein WC471_03435 [Candidatus Woesearchaeota archaeon]
MKRTIKCICENCKYYCRVRRIPWLHERGLCKNKKICKGGKYPVSPSTLRCEFGRKRKKKQA